MVTENIFYDKDGNVVSETENPKFVSMIEMDEKTKAIISSIYVEILEPNTEIKKRIRKTSSRE